MGILRAVPPGEEAAMIDLRKLKELVKLMVANDLAELDLRDPDEQVTLRRHADGTVVVPTPAAAAPATAAASVTAAATAAPVEGVEIASPMVGTFYASSNPDVAPFVAVGDTISEDSVVCIIEAMKIFNEIKAECAGTITKVLVESGQAVEFGQPLFLVEPT